MPTRRSAEPQVTVGVGVDLSEHEQMEKVGERARKALVRVEKGVLEKWLLFYKGVRKRAEINNSCYSVSNHHLLLINKYTQYGRR